MRRWFLLVLGLAITTSARADFVNLQPADGYNDFVLGNFTQQGTDAGANGTDNGLGIAVGGNFAPANNGGFTVHGSVVVGGNYTNNGNQIDGNIYGYNDVTFTNETVGGTVYAGRDLTISGGSEPGGGEKYVRNANVPGYFKNATQVDPTAIPHPVDFAAAGAYLKGEATTLHNAAGVGNVSFTANDLNLTGSGSNFYLFHVTATQFRTANQFEINVSGTGGKTPTVVVDVTDDGTAFQFKNLTAVYTGVTKQYVLFNFTTSGSIDTNGDAINGAVLAPNATVNFNSGHIDGTMIAGNLTGTGESHAFKFQGTLPTNSVPEPGSMVLLALGSMGGAAIFRRKRKKAAE